MQLYFSPLACSMATRISLYEAGVDARFLQVDGRAKRVADGTDFKAVNPMGMVPVLRLDDGSVLTENPAILLYVADRHPKAQLAPVDGADRYRLVQWLSFVGTELHKVVFNPLIDPSSNDGAREYARSKVKTRLDYLNAHLKGREFLLDRFTVADAYLTTVLNWANFTGVDLKPWAAVGDYLQRMQARPAVKKAMSEEFALYKEQQARREAQEKTTAATS